MSPHAAHAIGGLFGFPRVSGDEPAAVRADPSPTEFSPRERG